MMERNISMCCAQLNNRGVQELRQEKYDSALTSFTEALSLAKRLLFHLDQANEDDQGESRMEVDHDNIARTPTSTRSEGGRSAVVRADYSASTVVIPDKDKVMNHQSIENTLSCEWGNHGFIYRTPLKVSPDLPEDIDHEIAVEISVAVMFNLALAHHLCALHNPSAVGYDRESILRHALALYELTYKVQMQEDVELSIECTMAIINNLGQIHRALNNNVKAAQCFRHLLSTIFFVQSCGGEGEEYETEGFVDSVSHLILKKAAAPAA